MAITIGMDVHVPPVGPMQIYTQGFWYGVIAAVLYMVCSMSLMVRRIMPFPLRLPLSRIAGQHARLLSWPLYTTFQLDGLTEDLDSPDHAVLHLACWRRSCLRQC